MSSIDPWLLQFDWRPVSRIRVVVNNTPNDFYWFIYLIIPSSTGSVRIRAKLEHGNPARAFEWTTSRGPIPARLKRWDFRAAPGLRVHHIAQVIYSSDRELFQLPGRGPDSQFWVQVLSSTIS
ncbi:hypothetical protein DPV78_001721 [Talaromyces pinophilus]|jgi:hypothetical protein|nr:hypothetical protein DPV78_001721 [Talaromyces pinophilus]